MEDVGRSEGSVDGITIDGSSPVPPFEQLRSQLAGQVARGVLPAGTKLPTVRRLAADLGLAVNTVARAYRELEADQVLVTEGRRGTFVRSRILAGDPEGSQDGGQEGGQEGGQDGGAEVRHAAEELVRTARRAGLTRAEAVLLVERAWQT